MAQNNFYSWSSKIKEEKKKKSLNFGLRKPLALAPSLVPSLGPSLVKGYLRYDCPLLRTSYDIVLLFMTCHRVLNQYSRCSQQLSFTIKFSLKIFSITFTNTKFNIMKRIVEMNHIKVKKRGLCLGSRFFWQNQPCWMSSVIIISRDLKQLLFISDSRYYYHSQWCL